MVPILTVGLGTVKRADLWTAKPRP